MSGITAAVIVMFGSAAMWIGTVFLSLAYNKSGREPVRALYSISQWDTTKVAITGSCVIPPVPGQCVIEGQTGAYQDATHWCDSPSGVCIDPDTGENVKGENIPFKVSCADVPFCGWSKCYITFDGKSFVTVTQANILQAPGPLDVGAAAFFMERLSVNQSIVLDQNGTIARFHYLPPGGGPSYVLSYTNSWLLGTGVRVTKLSLTKTGDAALDYFVLMETMNTDVANDVPAGTIPRKILAFGGVNRTVNPGIDVIQDFNNHDPNSLWTAAKKYELVVINWDTDNAAYLALNVPNYADVLYNFQNNNPNAPLAQDIVEDRLRLTVGAGLGKKFYSME